MDRRAVLARSMRTTDPGVHDDYWIDTESVINQAIFWCITNISGIILLTAPVCPFVVRC